MSQKLQAKLSCSFFLFSMAIFSLLICILFVILLDSMNDLSVLNKMLVTFFAMFCGTTFVIWFVCFLGAFLESGLMLFTPNTELFKIFDEKGRKELCLLLFAFFSPIGLGTIPCYAVYWFFWKSGYRSSLCLMKDFCIFFKTAFIYIHSVERRICFVDTFLATVIASGIGYWQWNAPIAGLAGIIIGPFLGMANYWLVSVKWLKLVKPATS